MFKKKINIDNKRKITLLIQGLFFLFVITILIPLLSINYLLFSGFWSFFIENIIYSIISGIILFYFIMVGKYYYKFKIDNHVIQITSYRPLFSFIKKKDFVDISHKMLAHYKFLYRPLSLNKTLILKIRTDRGKKIKKQFNLTLISEKEIKKLSRTLDRVIEEK